jgi:hypothetical protein
VSAELPFAARKRATASLNNEEPKEEKREVGAAASSNVLDEPSIVGRFSRSIDMSWGLASRRSWREIDKSMRHY